MHALLNQRQMYFEKEDKQQLLYNLEKWDCIIGKSMESQMFALITYSSTHCKLDCKVLMEGYSVFREWILEHTELDGDYVLRVQSLAFSFKLKSGCYDNVYQLSGVIQQFHTECVVGGRVMTNSNLQHHVKKKIADLMHVFMSKCYVFHVRVFARVTESLN